MMEDSSVDTSVRIKLKNKQLTQKQIKEILSKNSMNPNWIVIASKDKITIGKDGKKKFKYPFGWNDIRKSKFVKNAKTYIVLTGEVSGITVIDCDSQSSFDLMIKKYPILKDTFIVKTQKGYHIYCKYNHIGRTTTNKNLNIDCRNNGGNVFGVGTTTDGDFTYSVYSGDFNNLVNAPNEAYHLICSRGAKVDLNSNINEEQRNTPLLTSHHIDDYHREIIDNIDKIYFYNYHDWFKIVMAFKNFFGDEGYEICKYLCEQQSNWDGGEGFYKLWKNNGYKELTWGTIEYYSRLSNEDTYLKIKTKYNPPDKCNTDYAISQSILEIIGDDVFIKKNDDKDYKLYMFDETTETFIDVDSCSSTKSRFESYIQRVVRVHYLESQKLIISQIQNLKEDDETERERLTALADMYGKIATKIGNSAKIGTVVAQLKRDLSSRIKDVIMDKNPNYFCFNMWINIFSCIIISSKTSRCILNFNSFFRT